jgi:PKHD-type hydroxylase
MQYVMTPHSTPVEPLAWWDGAFTKEELDWLQSYAKNSTTPAYVGGGGNNNINPDVRRSQISWLNNSQDTEWVFRKLGNVGAELNAKYFRFDLTGFGEALQMTNYNSDDHGMYGWHVDYGGPISRKLSLVVQLSDPSEYEGGELQIKTNANPLLVKKQRGYVAAFPSYTLHQVTPVTRGNRQSLVAWISGAPFR